MTEAVTAASEEFAPPPPPDDEERLVFARSLSSPTMSISSSSVWLQAEEIIVFSVISHFELTNNVN